MKFTRKSLALLLAATLISGVSCGDSGSSSDTTASDTTGAVTNAPEGYVYPEKGYNGYEFRVLNYERMWGCNNVLDYESETGESLSDAIYNRNRLVEEKLDIDFTEISIAYPGWDKISTIIDTVMQSTLADDDDFDAAILPPSFKPTLMTSSDGTVRWDNGDLTVSGGYINLFNAERALFI